MVNEKDDQKPVGTHEWYDFIGLMANGLPFIHASGKEATDHLIRACKIDASTRILDVGCGGGNTACRIAKEFGSLVVGIDISEVMVAKAKKRVEKEGVAQLVDFHTVDVYQMQFEDASFDVVLVESVLTPLAGNKVDALKEIKRVMKPAGLIGANEAVFLSDTPKDVMAIINKHPAIYEPFTEQTLRTAFEKAGFKVQELNVYDQADLPNPMKQMGCGGLISFFLKAYPKILIKLISDKRFRQASKIDDQITKLNKQYMRYALIVARKEK